MARLRRAVNDAAAGRRATLTRSELDAYAQEIRPDADATIELETVDGETVILVRATRRGPAPREPPSGLSPREGEVARLIADGLTNAEIAQRMGIRVSTVKDHVHRILERLKLRSRQQIVARVLGGPTQRPD